MMQNGFSFLVVLWRLFLLNGKGLYGDLFFEISFSMKFPVFVLFISSSPEPSTVAALRASLPVDPIPFDHVQFGACAWLLAKKLKVKTMNSRHCFFMTIAF
jgi:hypothetical protein